VASGVTCRCRKNLQFDPIEVKIREATSNDMNETSPALLADIARASEDPSQYPKLAAMLFKRLTDYEQFLHVQKAMFCVEYLLTNGSDEFVKECKRRKDEITKLGRYKYYNKDDEDIAVDVRESSNRCKALLESDKELDAARRKNDKYRGDGGAAAPAGKKGGAAFDFDDEDDARAAAEKKRRQAEERAKREAEIRNEEAQRQKDKPVEDVSKKMASASIKDEPPGPAGRAGFDDDPFAS